MTALDELRQIDIYLIDQMMKGRIHKEHKILDAGCGSARNMRYFLLNDFDIYGIDPSEVQISMNRGAYPNHSDQFVVSTIEAFNEPKKYNFIICNAVLHFAKNHEHFNQMFSALVALLQEDGVLFIRMTSDIGLKLTEVGRNGVYILPDGSTRYLITRSQIDKLLVRHELELLEPVKTVKVEELRSMTTLVFRKISALG
jgi:tellurite methyltransferase